jgi:hypothetical protein
MHTSQAFSLVAGLFLTPGRDPNPYLCTDSVYRL